MLADLRQGEQSVSDYSIQFRTLAAECEWNERAQWDMFLHGLADRIQREIEVVELPPGLDELVDLALRVDARLQQRESAYRPGSKNIKPNALSRIFDNSDRPVSPECIIPERLVVSAVTWEIESKVRTALEGVTPPPGCPTGRLFVPEGLRSNVIQWGHCSNVACHPGIGRTIFLVKQRFWWRAMARDI